MPQRLGRLVDDASCVPPVEAVISRRAAGSLAVLAYHAVNEPEQFGEHLDYLVAKKRPISLDEVIAATSESRALPKAAVLVTFDDGDRTVLELALPMLKQRGIPAVAFVIAGLIDGDRPPWWAEVQSLAQHAMETRGGEPADSDGLLRTLKQLPERRRLEVIDQLRDEQGSSGIRAPQLTGGDLRTLESGGIEIGNHTLTHPILSRCPDSQVAVEIVESHAILKGILGHDPRAFAFPDRDHDPRAETSLRRLNYQAAFLFDHRMCRLPIRNSLRISRLRVGSDTSIKRFRSIVNGMHPAVHRFIGRI
jgi:peptidoglycan/xylan/chitin deacetylase (PgdA/CDA1 family)